jgi:SAM-dependent methyltransferase
MKSNVVTDISSTVSNITESSIHVGTELVTFFNRDGLRMVGYHDYPVNRPKSEKWMLVLPGFGQTKTDVLAEAYFFAKNGFNALRCDYSFHVGESDGDIFNTNLERLKNDILSCLDFIYSEFAPIKVGAVARSLASRALLRAGTEDRRLRLLLNLVSIVDVQKTLFSIYQEDFFERVKQGKSIGIMDVLGFQVNADEFLRSAIDHSYENLQTTIEDVRQTEASVVFFAAEKDVWVDIGDVRQVIYSVPGKRKDLYILNGAMHELQESPTMFRAVLNGVVSSAFQHLLEPVENRFIVQPKLREIGFRVRKEKLRKRILYEATKENERFFWKSYLDKYSFVVNVPDYWELMTLISSLLELRDAQEGDSVLDAGCGIGNFGIYLLMKGMYAARKIPLNLRQRHPLRYVGVDFVEEAVLQSRQTIRRLEEEFLGPGPCDWQTRFFNARYILADLEFGLPFRAATFEKICCSLVLSYLQNPLESLGNMVELLARGGRIVVSSLKPFADLSQVYRNFIKVANKPSDIEEARKLLSNAGRIKVKEACGVYEFLSEATLVDFMKRVGLTEIESYQSLGNQANVVVGSKK